MSTFDLVVRGGRIADGTGGKITSGDVAVKDGVIAQVGAVSGTAAREIEADGALVTPGFVDIHTHYDGQVTWDSQLTPSSWHGVTTAVMGNCGVGFAPCRAEDHDRLIRLMEGVEDIPFPVLADGLPWNWETFPEYLASLSNKQFDIDFAAQVPHAAVRVYVMGERGANRDMATADDIAAMARIAREAVEAGALGFTTSRTLNHQTSEGDPTPTLTAAEDELMGIAIEIGKSGKGVLQVVSDFQKRRAEMDMFQRIVEMSGRPMSISVAQTDLAPDAWKWLLSEIEGANARGLEMRAQVAPRPVGILVGLELTLNPFTAYPAFAQIADKPLAEKVARLSDPAFRAELFGGTPASDHPFVQSLLRQFGKMFPLGDVPDYEPLPERMLDAEAARRGVAVEEVALDYMLSDGGRGPGTGMLLFPFLNYAQGSLDPSYAMMQHPNAVVGLSDGGAHMGTICDGSFPTTLLQHWTRDRTRGPKLDLAWAIKAQTADTARAVGLTDRGVLKPGMKADINVIDHAGLRLHGPEIAHDLPGGGRRLLQRADGYLATVVSGELVYENGSPTGALPGRLVRG
ncbi:amidohydrolase family protein [Pyruvatibacter sp.]|uniref:N-acyl-D-amino-acid deacylase family protein n=1 Tax=Pyruvatibacter sp. TaxID=1981328 RepID=UPI0032EAA613